MLNDEEEVEPEAIPCCSCCWAWRRPLCAVGWRGGPDDTVNEPSLAEASIEALECSGLDVAGGFSSVSSCNSEQIWIIGSALFKHALNLPSKLVCSYWADSSMDSST